MFLFSDTNYGCNNIFCSVSQCSQCSHFGISHCKSTHRWGNKNNASSPQGASHDMMMWLCYDLMTDTANKSIWHPGAKKAMRLRANKNSCKVNIWIAASLPQNIHNSTKPKSSSQWICSLIKMFGSSLLVIATITPTFQALLKAFYRANLLYTTKIFKEVPLWMQWLILFL